MSRIVAMAALVVLAGCATKKDIRFLRADMQAMAARQDSVLRSIQRQNTQLLDSIRATMRMTIDTRGNTTSQLGQFDSTMRQIRESLVDLNSSMTSMNRRMTALEEKEPVIISQGPPPATGPTAQEYYATGQARLGDQNFATARLAFEELLAKYPNDVLAPNAQFGIGETFVGDEDLPQAYRAFETVAMRWQTSPLAAQALFRAGKVAQDKRDNATARKYYTRVTKEYANSEESRAATRELVRLR